MGIAQLIRFRAGASDQIQVNRVTHKLSEPTLVQRPEMLPAAGSLAAHAMQAVALRVREVFAFIVRHKGDSPFINRQVEDGRLFFRYLVFHYLAGNIFIVRQGAKIAGVAIAWTERARDIEQRAALDEPQFAWRVPLSGGDAVMLGEVVGKRRLAGGWRKLALERWPDLHARRIFTHRRGRLKELPYAAIKRFCRATTIPVEFPHHD